MDKNNLSLLNPNLIKIRGTLEKLKNFSKVQLPKKKKQKKENRNLVKIVTKNKFSNIQSLLEDKPDVFDNDKSFPDFLEKLNNSIPNLKKIFRPSENDESISIVTIISMLSLFGISIGLLAKLLSPPSEELSMSGKVTEDFSSFVKKYESQKEGYKASYNKWAAGKDVNSMTVGEVLKEQEEALRDNKRTEITSGPNKGKRSSAVGLYQVTNTTLKELVKKGVVKKTDVFNKETQDKIGLYLLNRRGFSQFVQGKMTAKEFIKNLRLEWEGFKNVSDEELINFVERLKQEQLESQKPQPVDEKRVNEILKKDTFSDKEADKYIDYGKNTGSKEHFNELNPILKKKILGLAEYYHSKYNKKLKIESAKRSSLENLNVGGSPTSRHLQGLAVDIPQKQVLQLKDVLKSFGLESLGLKKNWKEEIHHIQLIENIQARNFSKVPDLYTEDFDSMSYEERFYSQNNEHTPNFTSLIYVNDTEHNVINEYYPESPKFPLSEALKVMG